MENSKDEYLKNRDKIYRSIYGNDDSKISLEVVLYDDSKNIVTEDRLYTDKGNARKLDGGFILSIDIDRKHLKGFIDDPYIKISKDGHKSRISMKTGEYIYHQGEPYYPLDNSQAKELTKIIKSKDANMGEYNKKGLSIYDAFYSAIEKAANEDNLKFKQFPMADIKKIDDKVYNDTKSNKQK